MDEQSKTEAEEITESNLKGFLTGYSECLLIFFTVIIFLARVFLFTSHPSDLVNLEQFPGECSDWAVLGCTRIVLKELGSTNGCLRPNDIPTTFDVIF